MSKFLVTDEIKDTVDRWLYMFSGDLEVRCAYPGMVYLVVDGLRGQEQYVHELGVFEDAEDAVHLLRDIINMSPRHNISPRSIVFSEIAKLQKEIGKS